MRPQARPNKRDTSHVALHQPGAQPSASVLSSRGEGEPLTSKAPSPPSVGPGQAACKRVHACPAGHVALSHSRCANHPAGGIKGVPHTTQASTRLVQCRSPTQNAELHGIRQHQSWLLGIFLQTHEENEGTSFHLNSTGAQEHDRNVHTFQKVYIFKGLPYFPPPKTLQVL